MVGARAKSDSSDARLLAAYAAAPDDVRGRKPHHVEVPEDAIRDELAELASRRDQLKHMIHAETCRLTTVRSAKLRQAITAHLDVLKAEDAADPQNNAGVGSRPRRSKKGPGPAQDYQGLR